LDRKIAQSISVANHYLHRKAPCSFAFGLFTEGVIAGVVLYGTPSNRNLRTGLCGPDEASNVIELTRLWVKDGVPKNAAGFLITHSVKQVDKEIVVSYADPSVGHIGTVYQAAGWIYTGVGAKRPEYTIRGLEHMHKQSIFDSLGRGKREKHGSQVAELREKYGDRLIIGEQIRKHRYVLIRGVRRKELIQKLRYPVQPYPKRLEQHDDRFKRGLDLV